MNSVRLSSQDVWLSTIVFGLLALFLLIPLQFIFKRDMYQQSVWPITIASAIFWGIFSVLFVIGLWDFYYVYFYPSWIRPLSPLNLILYSGFGIIFWLISTRANLPHILIFTLLGGLEGIAEHIFGVFALRILEKVPFLHGLSPMPVITFSFFEYAFYWCIVAWIAFGIGKLL